MAMMPQRTQLRSSLMKLCGAKATLSPCNIQMAPAMTRRVPAASRNGFSFKVDTFLRLLC